MRMNRNVLSDLRRRLSGWLVLRGILMFVGILGAVALALVLTDAALDLPDALRLLAPWCLGACAIGLAAALWWQWRKLNAHRIARLFEQSHPDLATSALANSPAGATSGPNAAETAFLAKLAERRTAVQQEIAATTEAAMLYATQLGTNSSSYDSSRVSSLLQDNGYYLKQLQKELFDLDLKNLEFRALCKH